MNPVSTVATIERDRTIGSTDVSSPVLTLNGRLDVIYELRTALTAIQGALSLLTQNKLDLQSSNGKRLLEITQNNIHRLVDLSDWLAGDDDWIQTHYQNNSEQEQHEPAVLERKLQASEARFRSIIANNTTSILILDNKGNVQFANPAAEFLFGQSLAALLGQSLFGELVQEVGETMKTTLCNWAQYHPKRMVQTYVKIPRPQGEFAIAEMEIVETLWEDRLAYLVSLRDVTERLKVEQERDRFFVISHNLLCITGFDGIFKRVNPAWTATLGYQEAELLDQPMLKFVDERDRALTEAELAKLVQGEEKVSFENRYQTANGTSRWLLWTVSAFPEEQLIYACAHDITERKQAEVRERKQASEVAITLQTLKNTQSQLIQAEKMSSIGNLVAGIAHEINNPIGFIHSNLEYVSEYAQQLLDVLALYHKHYPQPTADIEAVIEAIDLNFVKSDLEKVLSSMQLGTERIQAIVQSLRKFSYHDEAIVKPVDLHEGITNTLLILQHRLKPSSHHPGIRIIQEFGSLPRIEGQGGQLNQVFMNLLCNAIDALIAAEIDQPQIRIRTMQKNNRAIVEISDNGTGIPENIMPYLFDPFFTTKPVGQGTGLGLSICYQIIVHHHHGRIDCNSQLGWGTTFTIDIPIHQNSEQLRG
ncbi:MAG: PAS domain S-box protein [Spirulinaceae cyanobacterium]